MDVAVELVIKDATRVETDVLALKYAQANYGVDAVVSQLLIGAGRNPSLVRPKPGGFRLIDGVAGIKANKVLFIGVTTLFEFGYVEIREFSRRALAALAGSAPNTRRLALTLHGAGYGLDEYEAFEAEVAGLVDAIDSRDCPESLAEIVIPSGHITPPSKERHALEKRERLERLRSAGYASASKEHIFVAMSFKEDFDDVYHYGIQRAVRKAGFLCERADLSAFTGDVMEWVRTRIRSAKLVVGDLSEANPNVYLEVGYAWGCGIPTILIVRDTDHLRFDTRGQRCLPYKKIKDLEASLTSELKHLKKTGTI